MLARTQDFLYDDTLPFEAFQNLVSTDLTLETVGDYRCKLWADASKSSPDLVRNVAAALSRILIQEISHETEMESMSQEILARYEEVNLFYELSEELATIFDEKRIIEIILNKAREILLADAAWVYLRGEEDEQLSLFAKYCHLDRGNIAIQADIKVLCEWSYREQQAILVESIEDLPQIARDFETFYLFRSEQNFSALTSPIQVREKKMGVFAIARLHESEPFNGQDHRLMSAISSIMAVSLNTCQLIDKAKKRRNCPQGNPDCLQYSAKFVTPRNAQNFGDRSGQQIHCG
ncbi:MAG: GAF domain-containing protein [candidate division KSB1 bacterium]|nr:GAF domain-containing protein [candidate division KSB1 bacterium]